jgi:hypothetical protein
VLPLVRFGVSIATATLRKNLTASGMTATVSPAASDPIIEITAGGGVVAQGLQTAARLK